MTLFLVATTHALCQSISGTVLNENKKPMVGAYVTIETLKLTKTTNSEGKIYFAEIPSGEIKIKATHVGYKSQTKIIKVNTKSNYEVTFSMKFESNYLPEVAIIGSEGNKNNTKEISKAYLERTQALDIKDIFIAEPSVTVGGGGKNAQRIYLRGIEGSNLNITIDGAKQGRSLFQHRGNISSIDPSLLKQVKVSTGTDASQTSGGLGGSISFETIDAQDILTETKKIGGNISVGFISASNGYNTRATLGGKLNKYTGLLASASLDDQDDYRTGKNGIANNTAAKTQNYFAKLSILGYKSHELRLSSTYNKSTGYYITGGAGSDMGYPSDTLATQYQITSRNTYTLGYRFLPNNPWVKLKVDAYYNHRNLENKASSIDVTSNSFGGSLKDEIKIQFDKLKNTFTIGSDFEKEDGKSAAAASLGGGEQTNTSSTWSLFAQGESKIAILSLAYGLRRDDYKSDLGPYSLEGNKISPNVGLTIEPLKGLQLYASYSEALRASGIIPIQWMANITESTNFNDGKAFKPETSTMKEAGFKYNKYNLLTSSDKLSVSAKLFKTDMENLIERVGGGGGLVSKIWNDTLGVNSEGYEVSLSWEIKALQTRISYIHVNIEDKNGDPIGISRRKVAPTGDRFNWDLSWQINPEVQVGYTLNAIKRLKKVASTERPGYALHSVQALWKPKSVSGLTASFVINNLLNKQYSEQTSIDSGGTVMPEPGRDVRLSLTYNF